jgi:rhodanese-related sulfurtransferase
MTVAKGKSLYDFISFKGMKYLLISGLLIHALNTSGQINKTDMIKEKQTTLQLYVTSKEAYEMWKQAPEKIKILDVRTSEEFLYIGHAEMAWNIPAFLQVYQWDPEKKKLPMKLNPEFMAIVKRNFLPTDTILVTCRSGGRSAMAVNMLAEAGFKNVFNITDGFEGDQVKDPESVYNGQRIRNGWKNSGIPWTYEVNIERMIIPKGY